MTNKPKEYILCAAIHFKNERDANCKGIESGTVIAGRRHGDCYAILKNLLPIGTDPDSLPDREDQGFLTSFNRYVSRSEAFKIAKENNQIWYKLFDDVEEGILVSEDLY